MGTHCTHGFKYLEELKIGYKHSDGYFIGAGHKIIEYILTHTFEQMVSDFKRCKLVDPKKRVTMDDVESFEEKTGCSLKNLRIEAERKGGIDNYSIYSLFHNRGINEFTYYLQTDMIPDASKRFNEYSCSYNYIIDLDTKTFNYYEHVSLEYYNKYPNEFKKGKIVGTKNDRIRILCVSIPFEELKYPAEYWNWHKIAKHSKYLEFNEGLYFNDFIELLVNKYTIQKELEINRNV